MNSTMREKRSKAVLKWGRHNCTRSRTGSRRTLGQGMSRRGEDKLRIRELAATHCLTQRLGPALIKYLTHPPPLRIGHNFARIVITGRIGLRLRMSSKRSKGAPPQTSARSFQIGRGLPPPRQRALTFYASPRLDSELFETFPGIVRVVSWISVCSLLPM